MKDRRKVIGPGLPNNMLAEPGATGTGYGRTDAQSGHETRAATIDGALRRLGKRPGVIVGEAV